MNWKARLGDISAKYTIYKLKELDTRILIQYFFDEKNQLYLDIVIVLPWLKPLWRTTVKIFVSMFENHFNEWRNVDEVTATWEFEFSVNGPNLAHFEAVVKEAMDLHWGGKSGLYFKTPSLDILINASLMNNTVRRLSYEKVNLFCYGLDPKLRILSYESLLFVLDPNRYWIKLFFLAYVFFNFVENHAL